MKGHLFRCGGTPHRAGGTTHTRARDVQRRLLMPTTTRQDADFIGAVINDSLLEAAIEWIGSNMDPEDVFSKNDLGYWATDNGYIED